MGFVLNLNPTIPYATAWPLDQPQKGYPLPSPIEWIASTLFVGNNYAFAKGQERSCFSASLFRASYPVLVEYNEYLTLE
jgi:hypothetical protein